METQNSKLMYMALTVIIIIIIIPAILGYLGIMKWLRRKKYPPVAGTMFNQLLNFKKLHHYSRNTLKNTLKRNRKR